MSSPLIVNLAGGEPFDPAGILSSAWMSMRLQRLAPGAQERLIAEGVEYACYVVEGAGTVQTGAEEMGAAPGTALTLVAGSDALLRAGEKGLVVFVVTLVVPT